MKPASAPLQPPYDGPYDIPVIIDDRPKRLGDFQMTRCTFFTIEAAEMVDDWVAQLRAAEVPFLLMGRFAVLHRPDLSHERFTDPGQISALFDRIDDTPGLVVESAAVWFPNFIVERATGTAAPTEPDDEDVTRRGEVFRVDFALFQRALHYLNEVLSARRFAEQCAELAAGAGLMTPSPEETETFHRWSAAQIDAAKENYERQKADPERSVLPWRDEAGEVHPG